MPLTNSPSRDLTDRAPRWLKYSNGRFDATPATISNGVLPAMEAPAVRLLPMTEGLPWSEQLFPSSL